MIGLKHWKIQYPLILMLPTVFFNPKTTNPLVMITAVIV